MEFAYLEMLTPGMFRIGLATLGVAMGVFIVVGPIGTYITLTPQERLLNCVVAGTFSWPICYALYVVTVYLVRLRRVLLIGFAVTVVLLLASFPSAAIGYTFQTLFYSEHTAQLGFLTIYQMAATGTIACHVVFFYALCQRVRLAAARPVRQAAADIPPAALALTEGRRPFFAPAAIEPSGDLVFLKTDGRYVEVHTTTGSSRVIARFADVVSQLGDQGMPGAPLLLGRSSAHDRNGQARYPYPAAPYRRP